MEPKNVLLEILIGSGVVLLLTLIVRRNWMSPLALMVAFLGGYYIAASKILPTFPPGSGQGWIFYKVILIGIVAVATVNAPVPAKALVVVVLSADALYDVLARLIDRWPADQRLWWLMGVSAIAAAWFALMSTLIDRTRDWSAYVGITLAMGATAVLLIMGESAVYGQFGIVLAAAVAALAVSAILLKNPQILSTAMPAVAILMILLLAMGRHLASVQLLHAAILLSMPLIAWIGQIPAIERLSPGKRFTIRLILILIPLGTAVGLATPQFLRNMKGELY